VDTDGVKLKAVWFCSMIESSKIVLSQLSKPKFQNYEWMKQSISEMCSWLHQSFVSSEGYQVMQWSHHQMKNALLQGLFHWPDPPELLVSRTIPQDILQLDIFLSGSLVVDC